MPNSASIVAISSLGSTASSKTTSGRHIQGGARVARPASPSSWRRGVFVDAVSGGVVDTEALDHFPQKDRMIEWGTKRTPAGRLVQPEDIANAVAFLCSPEADMIRGHVLVVDGGFMLPA